MTIVYKGKVSGDTIEFTREMQGGERGGGGAAQKFTAKESQVRKPHHARVSR